ncbi:MAG TPA: hypothetical protein ENJ60_16370 [Aeromonadales bacterium]|nr:hypothetical protein [Aeromonadales bacterium]
MLFLSKQLFIICIFLLFLNNLLSAHEKVLDKKIASLLDNRVTRTEKQMLDILEQLDVLDRSYLLEQTIILFASNQEEYQKSWLLSWVFGMYACSEKDILQSTKSYVNASDVRIRQFIRSIRSEDQLKDIMDESRKMQKHFAIQLKKSGLKKSFHGRLVRCPE